MSTMREEIQDPVKELLFLCQVTSNVLQRQKPDAETALALKNKLTEHVADVMRPEVLHNLSGMRELPALRRLTVLHLCRKFIKDALRAIPDGLITDDQKTLLEQRKHLIDRMEQETLLNLEMKDGIVQ